ncbi:hypothetical protein JOD20_000697 [Herpetosiphon giganteus]|nr:hypothetical protein [Herpetosiphon giganteus]
MMTGRSISPYPPREPILASDYTITRAKATAAAC